MTLPNCVPANDKVLAKKKREQRDSNRDASRHRLRLARSQGNDDMIGDRASFWRSTIIAGEN